MAMVIRSLATKMWTPTASALRRRPGPSMPPPPARSRFVDTIHTQNGNATRKFSSDTDVSTRTLLERGRKELKDARKFKGYLRNLKFMRWTLNLGISATVVSMVVGRVNRV